MQNGQSNRTVVKSNGIGFFGLLGIMFIGLKLSSVISWSWWLVLLPLYGPLVLALAVMAFLGAVVGGFTLAESIKTKKIK